MAAQDGYEFTVAARYQQIVMARPFEGNALNTGRSDILTFDIIMGH
jgi:hypothetical protein